MSDSTSTDTIQISILGLSLAFTPPYSEGHVCTSAEARALNSTHGENMRNNLLRHVQQALEQARVGSFLLLPEQEQERLRSFAKAYAQTYHIGLGRPAQRPDPVQALARKLAREAILVQLRRAEIDPKTKDLSWFETKIEEALSGHQYFIAEARRRVESARTAAAELIDLDI